MDGPHIELIDTEGKVLAVRCIVPLGLGYYWIPSGATKVKETGCVTAVRICEPQRPDIVLSVERFLELVGWET